jgi:hypothetical protein
LLDAYDEGQQVDDLPLSDTNVLDKDIEVFDRKTGTSGRMGLQEAVRQSNAPWCGRVWNEANATSKAATWVGSLEMLQTLQDQLELGCYLVKNDHSRRKLDSSDHYMFAIGEKAKLDGSMGHYQWGWGKVFYYSVWRAGSLFYEVISLSPIPGHYNYKIPIGSMSASGFACIDRETTTLISCINDDPRYRGGDNNSSYDDTYRTLCGRAVSNSNIETFRAAARRNGSGWLCSTMRHNMVVKLLFEIIFGTRNMQDAYNPEKDSDGLYQGGLGMGVTEFGSWGSYNGYRPFLPSSVGVELGDACGVVDYDIKDADDNVVHTTHVPVFFGLKNAIGYLWRMQDDEFVKVNEDTSVTHLVAPSIYGTWTIGDETGMVAYSTSPTKCEGWVKTVSYDNLENFPTQVGASASTYHGSYLWNTSGATSGFRLVLRCCVADDGSPAGSSAVTVDNVVSSASVSFGVLLCEAAEDWPVEPTYAAAA